MTAALLTAILVVGIMSTQTNVVRVVVEAAKRTKIINSVEIPILTRCCLCVPLRKGLIAFSYINLVLTLALVGLLSFYITYLQRHGQDAADYPRLISDTVAMVLESAMAVVFIVALHKKHVFLMRLYLFFEIVFSIIGFFYSVAFLNKESASELLVILFQLTLQIYLAILIWSSIVKMERDGTVKYTRETRDMPV